MREPLKEQYGRDLASRHNALLHQRYLRETDHPPYGLKSSYSKVDVLYDGVQPTPRARRSSPLRSKDYLQRTSTYDLILSTMKPVPPPHYFPPTLAQLQPSGSSMVFAGPPLSNPHDARAGAHAPSVAQPRPTTWMDVLGTSAGLTAVAAPQPSQVAGRDSVRSRTLSGSSAQSHRSSHRSAGAKPRPSSAMPRTMSRPQQQRQQMQEGMPIAPSPSAAFIPHPLNPFVPVSTELLRGGEITGSGGSERGGELRDGAATAANVATATSTRTPKERKPRPSSAQPTAGGRALHTNRIEQTGYQTASMRAPWHNASVASLHGGSDGGDARSSSATSSEHSRVRGSERSGSQRGSRRYHHQKQQLSRSETAEELEAQQARRAARAASKDALAAKRVQLLEELDSIEADLAKASTAPTDSTIRTIASVCSNLSQVSAVSRASSAISRATSVRSDAMHSVVSSQSRPMRQSGKPRSTASAASREDVHAMAMAGKPSKDPHNNEYSQLLHCPHDDWQMPQQRT